MRLLRLLITVITFLLVALTSGCETVASNIDTEQELGQAVSAGEGVVVFGKVRWVFNDEELEIGTGIFSNVIELQMYPKGSDIRKIGKVGKGGEFTWVLAPGTYYVPAVNFLKQAFSSQGNFIGYTMMHFEVPETGGPAYLGTLVFETTYESHLFTYDAVTKSSIEDDCESDCAARLVALGLPEDELSVSLIELGPPLSDALSEAQQ